MLKVFYLDIEEGDNNNLDFWEKKCGVAHNTKSHKSQLLYLIGKAVIFDILQADYGINAENVHIETTLHGKPYLKNQTRPPFFFNISHSGKYWCCAVSDVDLGFDIEQISNKNRIDVARRFFHPKEIQDITESKVQNVKFCELWVAKEAYVKYTGNGISQGFSNFYISGDKVINEDGLQAELIPCDIDKAYKSIVCIEKKTASFELIKVTRNISNSNELIFVNRH